jgi:hypothetical protein
MAKHIEDFMALLPSLAPSDNWKTVLGILRLSNGNIEVIPLDQWNALLRLLRDVRESGILERIIQYSIRDPLWQVKAKIPNERLAQAWLESKQSEIQQIINDLSTKEWSTQVDILAKAIFGSSDINRLQFYTRRESESLSEKGLDGYVFAPGLNYLAAFIIDFFNREFQDLCDILLIRGQWTTINTSREMSDAFHGIKGMYEGIIELDDTLGDKGRNGPRLRAALLRVDRDRTQVRYINAIVTGINEEAQEMLVTAAQHFEVIENHMKKLVLDFERSPHELIINWKELTNYSKTPLGPRLAETSEKITSFGSLLNFFSRPPEGE